MGLAALEFNASFVLMCWLCLVCKVLHDSPLPLAMCVSLPFCMGLPCKFVWSARCCSPLPLIAFSLLRLQPYAGLRRAIHDKAKSMLLRESPYQVLDSWIEAALKDVMAAASTPLPADDLQPGSKEHRAALLMRDFDGAVFQVRGLQHWRLGGWSSYVMMDVGVYWSWWQYVWFL